MDMSKVVSIDTNIYWIIIRYFKSGNETKEGQMEKSKKETWSTEYTI